MARTKQTARNADRKQRPQQRPQQHPQQPRSAATSSAHSSRVALLGHYLRLHPLAAAGKSAELAAGLAALTPRDRRIVASVESVYETFPDLDEELVEEPSSTNGMLESALQHGDVATVRVLLEAGASANARDVDGWPALHQLTTSAMSERARANASDLLRVLLEHGADPEFKDDDDCTAIMRFCNCSGPVGGELARTLLQERQVDLLRTRTIFGHTALNVAIESAPDDVVELMLARGAVQHIETPFPSGESPLAMACLRETPGAAVALLRKGARPQVPSSVPHLTREGHAVMQATLAEALRIVGAGNAGVPPSS